MKTSRQSGFTLVELMVGLIAASILAVTAGLMLAQAYQGWIRAMAVADMERDAAVALHTLDVAVRGASNAVPNASGSTLTVDIPPYPSRVFSSSGTSPRGSLSYNGMTLVNGRLVTFTNSVANGGITITMTLAGIDRNNRDTEVRMGVTNLFIKMRNAP